MRRSLRQQFGKHPPHCGRLVGALLHYVLGISDFSPAMRRPAGRNAADVCRTAVANSAALRRPGRRNAVDFTEMLFGSAAKSTEMLSRSAAKNRRIATSGTWWGPGHSVFLPFLKSFYEMQSLALQKPCILLFFYRTRGRLAPWVIPRRAITIREYIL